MRSAGTARAVPALALLALAGGCGASAPVSPAPIVEVPAPPPLVTSAGLAASAAPAEAPAGAARIAWETDERAARELARRDHRPLLVSIRADWDAVSLRQDRELWTDPRVVEAARGFVAVRIDVSDADSLASQAYAERYDVEMLPTIVVVDADGARSASLEGDVDAARLVEALRDVE